jgi:hypothetical protein
MEFPRLLDEERTTSRVVRTKCVAAEGAILVDRRV